MLLGKEKPNYNVYILLAVRIFNDSFTIYQIVFAGPLILKYLIRFSKVLQIVSIFI